VDDFVPNIPRCPSDLILILLLLALEGVEL